MNLVRRLVVGAWGLGIIALAALTAVPAMAQTQVADFTGGNQLFPLGDNTLGWEFNLTSTLTVTDLGVFDEGSDGFTDAHQVGLWTSGGTLLSSTTLATGLSGTPVVSGSGLGVFRYNSVSPLVLTPGDYVIGALYPTFADTTRINTATVSMAAGFSFVQLRFNNSGGFIFPALTTATQGHFGPNLRVTEAPPAAPEPGSLALLAAAGLVGFVLTRRKAH